ncbi:Melanoma-associated antigen 10 [Vulpes lagopus]
MFMEDGGTPHPSPQDFKNWQRRPRSEAGVPQDTELRTCGPEPLVQVQPESATMSLGKSNELWELGEDPEEAQGLLDTQQSRAEEEEGQVPSPPSPSLSSSPYFSLSGVLPGTPQEGSALEGSLSPLQSSQSAYSFPFDGAASGLGQPQPAGPNSPGEQEDEQPEGSFHMKTAALVMLLLLKYRIKQPISKEQMLEVITPEFQDDFPVILSQASRCLRLVLGLDVIEVDPIEHCYHLNIILGLTWDGMVSGQGGLPKTSLLGLVLGLIVLEDDCAPEEEVWEALRVMEVYDGQEHIIYGEPRDLLTNVWVQEGYLECRLVVGSNPARYEFLWGPRAHVETSKFQVMDYAFQVSSSLMVSSLALCEQILR